MSREYYQYQDVKVRIAHRLFKLNGWTVYGYHADNSDAMTDYYDPAYWGGIAEKNGYRLVVDHSSAAEERRYSIHTTEKISSDAKTREKIAKLEELTQERGATEAEEAAAKRAISAILAKGQKEEESKTAYKEIIEPGHMANPPRCNWHIEKDGVIIDKGTGLLKFASVPDITRERELKDWQDYNNLSADEWKENRAKDIRHYWSWVAEEDAAKQAESQYTDAQEDYALLEKFNILINRWDTTCGGMMGNTDDFYTYQEITVTEYKTEIKPQETAAGELKEGQHIVIKSHGFNYGVCAGYVYVIHARENSKSGKYYVVNRLNGKNTKELTGSANPANCLGYFSGNKDINRLLKWIEKGAVAWCDLVEVKTPYEVKKVVKKKVTATAENTAAQEAEAAKVVQNTSAEENPVEAEKEATESAESIVEESTAAPVAEAKPAEDTAAEATEEAKEKTEATETEATEAAEAAPDMFATLAAAFVAGKTVKAKPRKTTAAPEAAKNQEPEAKTEEPPEAETAPEPEPEPEPPAPGYHENQNNSGQFTAEERKSLSAGIPVVHGDRSGINAYFTAPYMDNVRLLYSVYAYDQRQTIPPGATPKYCGFMIGEDLYTHQTAIAKKFTEDVNSYLMAKLATENDAAQAAANATDYEKKKIEWYKEHDFTDTARRFFYDGKKPELVLFSDKIENVEQIIDYVRDPEKAIEQKALAYLKFYSVKIYKEWIEFNRVSAAYESIVSDTENEEHKLLKISRAITDQKTVKIELTNGHEVKAEADAVKRITYCGRISDYDVAASDRQYLTKNERGYTDGIHLSEIVAIRHGGRVLYQAS